MTPTEALEKIREDARYVDPECSDLQASHLALAQALVDVYILCSGERSAAAHAAQSIAQRALIEAAGEEHGVLKEV